MSRFAVVGRRILTERGLEEAAVLIGDGRIEAIVEPDRLPSGVARRDVGDDVVLPGLVDAHVHVNEPGRTEWEGFASATKAAAAGGVTTIVDMPLNSIPATTSPEALAQKLDAARGRLSVDCAFWGGVVPANAHDPEVLGKLIDDGVCGFKAFLVPSGVDEFPHVAEGDLRRALPVLAARGVPFLAHAELESPVPPGGDPRRYATYLASRPPAWENDAIRLLIRLSRDTGAAVHIVHLSSAEAIADLRAARREGLLLTAETCPHYLFFTAEDVPDGRTEYKCSPPIREAGNREALWAGLQDGVIDLVVSDHSPCTPERKGLERGDFLAAWGGIASLQLRLPVVLTEAKRRGIGWDKVADWLCRRPAELAGLGRRKGRLEPGYDADLVVLQPEESFDVAAAGLHHRHKVTPYLGRRLFGAVKTTYLRGEVIYDRGSFPGEPRGRALTRDHGHLH